MGLRFTEPLISFSALHSMASDKISTKLHGFRWNIHKIFFLFLHKNIHCGYSLEAPRLLWRNKEDVSIFQLKKTTTKNLIWSYTVSMTGKYFERIPNKNRHGFHHIITRTCLWDLDTGCGTQKKKNPSLRNVMLPEIHEHMVLGPHHQWDMMMSTPNI